MEVFFFLFYLAIFPFLFNSNAVPIVQLNWFKIENVISISIDSTGEMQGSFSVHKNGRDSVSNFSHITCSSIPLKGNNTGPTMPASNMRVDLQIKTDPELGTPARNVSNLRIFNWVSKLTDVFPDQMFVGRISCRVEIVSSKDCHILECSRIMVFHSM